MNFEFRISQAVIGHNIELKIKREGDRLIHTVETELDNLVLASDDINPPAVHLERSFTQVGNWSPNQTHELIVRVFDQGGEEEVGTKIFVNG